MSVSGERGEILCIIGSGGKGWETDHMATYVISDIHDKYVKFMELLDGIKPEKYHTRKKGENI